jgi:hypothetical protein
MIALSMCLYCRRRDELGGCEAFPGGIPREILAGKIDHRRPVRGDRGLQFVEAPGLPEGAKASLERALSRHGRQASAGEGEGPGGGQADRQTAARGAETDLGEGHNARPEG